MPAVHRVTVRPGAPLTLRLHDAPLDEGPIIEAARLGDPEARAWLASHYTPPVYRFALRMLADPQDARDAAQDTMVKVLRNLDRYDERWRFTTWVFGIARNTCIDEHRRRRRQPEALPEQVMDRQAGPHELTSRAERARLIHLALAQLPPLYREVIVLYHFEHLKYEEIAATLDLPMGTVMNRIFRARRKLRDAYLELGGGADGPGLEAGGEP